MTITPGAPADLHRIDDLPAMPEDAWISIVVRNNRRLLPVSGESQLHAGDQLLIVADPDLHDTRTTTFATAQPESPE